MRLRLPVLLLVAALVDAAGGCDCGPPPGPVDAGQIGDGTPIEERDAGFIDPNDDAGPPPCEDDPLEDNDDRTTATVLTTADPVAGAVCGADDDFFAVDTAAGCSLVADLTFNADIASGGGDLDMIIFDPNGQTIGAANTLGNEEHLNVRAPTDGRYALRVRGGSRDTPAYTLSYRAVCSSDLTCPADDEHEENDAVGQPAPIASGVSTDGVLCGADEDFYLVPVALGCVADARLSFVDNDGDIDIELLRADGTVVGGSRGVSDQERLTKGVTTGGMAYRVYFGVADSENDYRLTVDEVCAVSCPADDPFEPNDERTSPVRLFAGGDEVLGAACAGNQDFFDVIPQQGCTLHAFLDFVHAVGDLDLELLDTSGARLQISQSTDDDENLDFAAPSSARVVLRVFGFSNANNTYRLTLSTTCP